MIKLKLPTKVTLGKRVKKEYPIQFNKYHTWYKATRNDIKQKYSEDMQGILSKFDPLECPVKFHYKLTVKDRHTRDLDGTVFLIHKYFADAVVKAGLIKTDNCFDLNRITMDCVGLNRDLKEPYIVEVTIYDRTDTCQ